MSIFKWVEKKLFTGETLKDFGDIQDVRKGIARIRTSVSLCKRKGKIQLVFRNLGTSPFGFNSMYAHVDITPESIGKLEEIIAEAKHWQSPVPPVLPFG